MAQHLGLVEEVNKAYKPESLPLLPAGEKVPEGRLRGVFQQSLYVCFPPVASPLLVGTLQIDQDREPDRGNNAIKKAKENLSSSPACGGRGWREATGEGWLPQASALVSITDDRRALWMRENSGSSLKFATASS